MFDTKKESTPMIPPRDKMEDGKFKSVHQRKGTSVVNTGILLMGEMLGVGVLTLPKTLDQIGWGAAFIISAAGLMSACTGIHLGYCWNILLERYPEYREHIREPYPAIAEKAFGKWMRYLIKTTLAIAMFGAGVIYLLLVAQNIYSLFGQVGVNLSFCLWMIIIAVVITPFQWLGSPKDFWLVGLGATGASVVCFLLMFITFMLQLPKEDNVTHINRASFQSVFMAFGSIMFGWGGVPTYPTYQHDMKDPSRFSIAVLLCFVVSLSVFLPIGVTGYVVFGNEVNSNVLLSLPEGGLRISIEVFMTVHLFFAFTILLNPASQMADEILNIPNEFGIKRILVRSAIVGCILFTGQSFPHFSALVALTGGSTLTFLTFVAPSVFYLKLCSQSGDWMPRIVPFYQKVMHIIIIVIGGVTCIVSTYSGFVELFSPNSFVQPCYINSTVTES